MLFDMKYEINKAIEKTTTKFVWALPKNVVLWAYIRVVANATSGKYSDHPDDVTYTQALERWEQPNEWTFPEHTGGGSVSIENLFVGDLKEEAVQEVVQGVAKSTSSLQ